ncbi:unnamed protein product, partial [Rotaria socialis]
MLTKTIAYTTNNGNL